MRHCLRVREAVKALGRQSDSFSDADLGQFYRRIVANAVLTPLGGLMYQVHGTLFRVLSTVSDEELGRSIRLAIRTMGTLAGEVKALGGSDDGLCLLFSDDRLARRVAKAIVDYQEDQEWEGKEKPPILLGERPKLDVDMYPAEFREEDPRSWDEMLNDSGLALDPDWEIGEREFPVFAGDIVPGRTYRLALAEFDRPRSFQQALAGAHKHGLEPPSIGDAFRFAQRFPTALAGTIAVPCHPWYADDGNIYIPVLQAIPDEEVHALTLQDITLPFNACRFLFRSPSQ